MATLACWTIQKELSHCSTISRHYRSNFLKYFKLLNWLSMYILLITIFNYFQLKNVSWDAIISFSIAKTKIKQTFGFGKLLNFGQLTALAKLSKILIFIVNKIISNRRVISNEFDTYFETLALKLNDAESS